MNLTANKSKINLNRLERLASLSVGSALIVGGLSRRSALGLGSALAGGLMILRGATGYCPMYEVVGVNTAKGELGAGKTWTGQNPVKGMKVVRSVTVNRPAPDLFRFWRDFENLPRIMGHLESVTTYDNGYSHWSAKAPTGQSVSWEAKIINEKENELIAWKSVEGSQIENAGTVEFRQAPGDRGTEVKVVLNYEPPAGIIGAGIAKLFGEEPGMQIDKDLLRFKQLMESGEIPTTQGQPRGRSKRSGDKQAGKHDHNGHTIRREAKSLAEA